MEQKKILISAGMIAMLAILITVFSVFHTRHMGGAFLQYPLFLYGTAILSLAVGGSIVYMLEEKVDSRKLEKILSILPPDERKVMKLLLERKEIEQKRLATLSGLSSVKVSRVVSALERRGIVEKKRHGYTNLIVLGL